MIDFLLQLTANIPAALVGGATFVVCSFVLELEFSLSFMLGLSGYIIGGVWIFPSFSVPKLKTQAPDKMFDPVFDENSRQLAAMRSFAANISDHETYEIARYICDVAEEILETLQEQGGIERTAQQFSTYYLEPAAKILKKYQELENSRHARNGGRERIALILESVQLAFEKQLSNVLNDGMLYLDLEIAALEETLRDHFR